jgi:hypothetical protein
MSQDHVTEAACLLKQGASYRKRIGLEPVSGAEDPIFAGFKQAAFSLYFGDAPIYHFDLEGRWQRAFAGGTHYLKGLDGCVHAIDRVRDGENLVLKRRALDDGEAGELDAQVRSVAMAMISDLDGGRVSQVEPPAQKAEPIATSELRAFLERISGWDGARWSTHRERYERAYGPMPFLPPECLNAVVVQATVGNAGGMSFALGPVSQTVVRSAAEVEAHAREVAAIWGLRLLQSRSLFLAGSDVLCQPVDSIAAYLDAIARAFPIKPKPPGASTDRSRDDDTPHFDGVHAFLDDFARPRPDACGWRELATRGLMRVSLGVESGSPEVRTIYQKDWTDDALRRAVSECKGAGLGVSVLTLVGAGGIELGEPHVERTARLIESLELGAGDFVFLLDEREIGRSDAVVPAETRLGGQAWIDQQTKLKAALAPMKLRSVKVLPYTVEKQWT